MDDKNTIPFAMNSRKHMPNTKHSWNFCTGVEQNMQKIAKASDDKTSFPELNDTDLEKYKV